MLSISQQGRSSQLPVWNTVRRAAAWADPWFDSIDYWRWLQGRNEECRSYSLQPVTYRCRCLGINTTRLRHESHTTFHNSERRCRTNYHSRKRHRNGSYMCVLRFNIAAIFVGTMGSHHTKQLSIYQSMILRLHMVPQPAAHCRSSIVWEGEIPIEIPISYFIGKRTWIKSSMHIDCHSGIGVFRRWRPRSRSLHNVVMK